MPGQRSGAAPGARAARPTWSSTSPRGAAETAARPSGRARARNPPRGRGRYASRRRAASARSASRSRRCGPPAARRGSCLGGVAPSSRRERAFLGELLDLRGCDHAVFPEVALVVAFHVREPIGVVNHESRGTAHSLRGSVAHPVDALEYRAVTQVKTRNAVERLAPLPSGGALLRMKQVARAKPHEQALQRIGNSALVPCRIGKAAEQGQSLDPFGAGGEARAVLFQPAAETRHRRQRGEVAQVRELALELLSHLLDEQVAERYPAQPRLAV